jgi:hypothetical protein
MIDKLGPSFKNVTVPGQLISDTAPSALAGLATDQAETLR